MFTIIALILQREELDYEYLRLDDENVILRSFQHELGTVDNSEQLLAQKRSVIQEISCNYYKFFTDCFLKALQSIKRRRHEGLTEEFLEITISIAFSRIPQF